MKLRPAVGRSQIDLVNVFVVLVPLFLSLTLGIPYTFQHGIHSPELVTFLLMVLSTGLAITAGYHRYFSHRSYQCHRVVQLYYLFFGVAAMQFSLMDWVSRHRDHHRFVDTQQDPYNIRKGFFWAHLNWIFFSRSFRPLSEYENVNDLKKDPLIVWQHRYALETALLIGLGIPILIGFLTDDLIGCLLWGGPIRIVVVHHCTFLTNSAAHTFGHQRYDQTNSSRNSHLFAIFNLGEGYHNYHHAYPYDYRNGVKWYEIDATKWFIFFLSQVGLATHLRKAKKIRRFYYLEHHRIQK